MLYFCKYEYIYTSDTGPAALSVSYSVVPVTLSLELKRPWWEADHPPSSSGDVKNEWSYASSSL
jgi:hypothetical protein